MERSKKEGENAHRNKLMIADENVMNWHLRGKNFKENILRHVGGRSDEKELKNAVKKPEKNQQGEQAGRPKSPKKDLLYLHLKPFMKSKTAREPPETKEEVKRYRKPSDRMMKRKESGRGVLPQEKPNCGVLSFNNAWEHTNYSIVPTVQETEAKETNIKERRRKRSQKVRKRNKSDHRLDTRNLELVLGGVEQNAKMKVIPPSFGDFVKDRKNESGKAVVIYHRRNKRKYHHPHTGDGYQFEQIAFKSSCEATVDMAQSKRSLSEPRQNSTKELYVTRRRTRFQVEPHKMEATQSDFRSAIDFFKQSPGSIEFKKFEEIKSSFSTLLCPNPISKKYIPGKNYEDGVSANQMILTKSLSSTNTNTMLGVRLQNTAQKKLDLHKEMIRAEKNNKKKFWESIERSLNYRCALADMISSRSYVSSKESSKFFSSAENTTNRSTNIYVRESVISSFEGFSRFITSKKAESRNISKPLQLKQPYRSVKTVLDTILIKEDDEEEEEIVLREHIDEGFTSQSSSNSTVNPYDINSCFHYASDKLSLIESTLGNSDTNSKLELLMARLSEEIRKCSQYMKKLNETTKKTVLNYSSASDSKIDLTKKEEIPEKKNPFGWGTEEKIVYPVFVYSASDILLDYPNMGVHRAKKDKCLDIMRGKKEAVVVEKEPESPKLSEDVPVKSRFDGFQCCEDCKLLKKRIIRLEQDLEKIEKRMPLYPSEYQETIKDCLESLNVTSETFLKRLKSCAKLRCWDQHKKCKKGKHHASKRSSSAPGPVLHEFCTRPVHLRPSGSDCHLNVGMELTMENIDPITGERVYPVKGNTKQEGNVQCRLLQDGRKPLLMMDTDFCYSPDTGMLFKDKNHCGGGNPSSEVVVPLGREKRRPPSVREMRGAHRRCSQVHQHLELDDEHFNSPFGLRKPSKKDHRDVSPEVRFHPNPDEGEMGNRISPRTSKSRGPSGRSICKSQESGEEYLDSNRMSKDVDKNHQTPKVLFMANKNNRKTGKVVSQIPIRRKPTPNIKLDCESPNGSSTTFTILPMGLESRCLKSSASAKNPENSCKAEKTAVRFLSATEVFPFLDKSTQTYPKPGSALEQPNEKIKTSNIGVQGRFPIKHYGVQVGAKRCHEEIQVESLTPVVEPEPLKLEQSETCSKPEAVYTVPNTTTTMNVAVQASTLKRKKNTSSVGLQIKLPSEESLKYINDLQIQKKVNMAIAELCFHLSQEKEQEEV